MSGLRRLLDEISDQATATRTLAAGSAFNRVSSDTGWVVFELTGGNLAISPPFELVPEATRPGFHPQALLEQIEQPATTAIVLVRLGRYAVGVFNGRDLVSSKTETRYVGSQHKAGGWSQKRFVRIREKQARELYDKVCTVSQEKLAPYDSQIARLWLGGDRHVLDGFKKRCPWLGRFATRTADRLLSTPVPDLAGLKASIDDALRYRVIRQEDGEH